MPKETRKQTLTERLLRYSAVASVATSGALLAGAPQALADGTSRVLDCVMNTAGASCDIDFDNDGNPEFRLFLDSYYQSDLWMNRLSGGGEIRVFHFSELTGFTGLKGLAG